MKSLTNLYRSLLCLIVTAVPVTATADLAMGNISFAWVYHPLEAPENLPGQYFHNTLGNSVQFKRNAEGSYKVAFSRPDNVSPGGGNVQVTAFFSDHYCKVVSWTPSFEVNVRCFDAEGSPAETHFLVLATRPPRHGRDFLAYLWANEPAAARYRPQSAYSYNSTGGGIAVARTREGVYRVEIDSDGVDAVAIGGGNVQVTAYGPGAEYCKSNGWVGYGTPYTFRVLCFDPDGRPTDSRFTALVLRPGDERSKSGITATHDSFYQYSGADASIRTSRVGTGRQTVVFANLGDTRVLTEGGDRIGPIAGHIQVSATGRGPERCSVREWGTGRDTEVQVSCFDASGDLADSDFSLLALFPGEGNSGH